MHRPSMPNSVARRRASRQLEVLQGRHRSNPRTTTFNRAVTNRSQAANFHHRTKQVPSYSKVVIHSRTAMVLAATMNMGLIWPMLRSTALT